MSIAYWCLLAGGLFLFLCVGIAKANSAYDNADPRRPDLYRGLAGRAHAAHHNGFEAFPLFAVAVLVASHGSPQASIFFLDTLAIAWVVLRIVYLVAYLGNQPLLRSTVWSFALVVSVAIFTIPAWHA